MFQPAMPSAKSNAAAFPSAIVPEVLEKYNYERWSIFMRHYLIAQDLWNVVLSSKMPHGENSRGWIKKSALTLHAIKISCGEEMFELVKKMNSAKEAWDALANLHKPQNEDGYGGSEIDTGLLCNNRTDEFVSVVKIIRDGDWNALKSLDGITERVFPGGFTVLHLATLARHLRIVKQLVNVATQDYLQIRDENGDTVLSLAAYNGELKIAECLVQNNADLLTIPNNEGNIPLLLACVSGHKDMASYLYSITPIDILLQENSNLGAKFIKYCVLNSMPDVGLDLFLRYPDLSASTESITITELSVRPSLFPGKTVETRLTAKFLFRYLVYACLSTVKLPSPCECLNRYRHKIFRIEVARVKLISGILGIVFFPARDEVQKIYNLKINHMYANSVLHYWCEKISTYGDVKILVESGAISAIFQAIKHGISEIVIEILKANPDLIWCNRNLTREILISAIKHRQGNILRFVYSHDAGKQAFLSLRDEDGNNMLHLVAKLPEVDRRIISAAWELQNEVKWFEEIKCVLPSCYIEDKNLYDETPDQIFNREHQELTKEGAEWAKSTADSYIIVAVLVVTIMFAAAFTVPGGYNQESGFPIFLLRELFLWFILCDAVSLFAASTALFLFLEIRMSCYDEVFFLKGVLAQLTFATSALVVSIGAMILTFIIAVTMMVLQDKWQLVPGSKRIWLVVPFLITNLAGFSFGILLWWPSTFVNLCVSTFRSRIFK